MPLSTKILLLGCFLAAAENASAAEIYADACPVSSRTAMNWYVIEAAVAEKISLGNSTAVDACKFVSFMDFVLDGYTFVGITYAFSLVIVANGLSMLASIPRAENKIGKMGFFLWGGSVVVQYLFVLMSLISFVTGVHSAITLYADCLVEGTTKYKLFSLVGIFGGAFHPYVLSCHWLMILYMAILAEGYRIWEARGGEEDPGEDKLAGDWITSVTESIFFLHCWWPLFNFLIWLFSLSILFSVVYVPTALFVGGSMFVLIAFLGMLHHDWAKQIIVGKWKKKEHPEYSILPYRSGDPEDKMKSCVPTPVVEAVCNVTAPYHYFYVEIVCKLELPKEEYSGQAFATLVNVALFLFSLSPLVLHSIQHALHTYSAGGGWPSALFDFQLINEIYGFTYDSFNHAPRFHQPIFDLDFAKALTSLPDTWALVSQGLDWGPENYMQLSHAQNTLSILIGLIKPLISMLYVVLGYCGIVAPNISTAAAASGAKLDLKKKKMKSTGISTCFKCFTRKNEVEKNSIDTNSKDVVKNPTSNREATAEGVV
jgi:hypothetical protein